MPTDETKTGRKKLPAKKKLINQGVKIPPTFAEHIAQKGAELDMKPGTVAREYLIFGIETERKSPGLFEAMVFWNTLNQLPADWRSIIVKLVQMLNNAQLEADATPPKSRIGQAEEVEKPSGGRRQI